MGSLFSTPKYEAPVQEVVPEVVDNSEQVKGEENRRKKRRGMASQIVSLNSSSGSSGGMGKSTLGA